MHWGRPNEPAHATAHATAHAKTARKPAPPLSPRHPRHYAHVRTRAHAAHKKTLSRVYNCRGCRGLSGYKGFRGVLAWATAWIPVFLAWAGVKCVIFQLMGPYWMQSEHDYIICKCKAGGGWLYVCYGPAMAEADYRASFRVHYRQGEPLPARRRYLATMPDADSAKTACERHWQAQQRKPA